MFLGNTVDDDTCTNKPKENLRQERKNSRLSEDDKDIKPSRDSDKDAKHKEPEEKKPERNKKFSIKSKRVSADERLVADNRTYYKVEVMTAKLRSSGLGIREHELAKRSQTPLPDENDEKETSLVVKFKKVRRSELSVLNDEAENFMFPRKDDPSYDDMNMEDGPNTTCSTIKHDSIEIHSSEPEIKSNFKIEPSEDSVEEFLDSSVPLKDRFKCEIDAASRRKVKNDEDVHTPKTFRNCVRQESVPQRRSLRKCEVLNLDDSAQDGSAMIENRRRRRLEHIDYAEDTEVSKDGTSRDSVSNCDSEGRRRKRRSHAEAFIEDNRKYFKFETPGSRLRYVFYFKMAIFL